MKFQIPKYNLHEMVRFQFGNHECVGEIIAVKSKQWSSDSTQVKSVVSYEVFDSAERQRYRVEENAILGTINLK